MQCVNEFVMVSQCMVTGYSCERRAKISGTKSVSNLILAVRCQGITEAFQV